MQSQIKHSVVPTPKQRPFLFHKKHVFFVLILVFIVCLLWSVIWSEKALQSIKLGKTDLASTNAMYAKPFVTLLSICTLHQSASIELWHESLALIVQTNKLQKSVEGYASSALENDPRSSVRAAQLLTVVRPFNETLIQTIQLSQRSVVFKQFIEKKLPKTVQKQLENSSQLVQLIRSTEVTIDRLLNDEHRFILLFQNTDELRATGGFMGSYAIIDTSQGAISPIQFYDIYDADGQIKTELEAPPGVKEYLSGGQGLRLPNANWSPDFPTSAQNILQFFALSGIHSVDGVVVMNLPVLQQLLALTGPIEITGSNEPATTDNVSELLRADRAAYFPGSKQKRYLIRSLSTQLRLKLQNLSSAQKMQLFQILIQNIPQKNIQLFFHQPELQQFSRLIKASGQLTTQSQPLFLQLVESNVGINKANRKVERQVGVEIGDKTMSVNIQYNNKNVTTRSSSPVTPVTTPVLRENPHNDYINYLRVLVPVGTKVLRLQQDSQTILVWDESSIVSSNGETFTQIGFLAPVAEEQLSLVSIQLELTISFQLNPALMVQKQSGLPPTAYTVTYGNQSKNLVLDQDEVIQFRP